MRIAQEEIFGPVISIITYEDEEEALQIANDSIYGLNGAVHGPHDAAVAFAREIENGQCLHQRLRTRCIRSFRRLQTKRHRTRRRH